MTLERYNDAVLISDLPEHGLKAGDVGTVVERHVGQAGRIGYSVEFFDLAGNTLAVAVVGADQLRRPTAGDVLTVRGQAAG